MPLWLWFVDSLVFLIVLALALVVALLVRRRILTRQGGSFDMSVNRREGPGAKGWTLGLAVYRDSELDWYRTFSYSLRPRHRFARGEVHVGHRRDPVGAEVHALHAGHLIVPVETEAGIRQFAMSPNALTGFLSWLESSPPGHRVNQVL